ncbi:MAG: hypothetical protein R2771_02915 [Saprospiraceae bacterium]
MGTRWTWTHLSRCYFTIWNGAISPDTRLDGWDGCSGYHYSDSLIYGFSHTHLNGTGASDYGDILVMPVSGRFEIKDYGYASMYNHNSEVANPGYYRVFLENRDIDVQLTSTQRVGVYKYKYKNKKDNSIVLDLNHRDYVLAKLKW